MRSESPIDLKDCSCSEYDEGKTVVMSASGSASRARRMRLNISKFHLAAGVLRLTLRKWLAGLFIVMHEINGCDV